MTLHPFTMLAFALHIGGGTIGLISGTIALFVRKGGRLHRAAGNIFFFSMLVMAVFALYLAVVIPGQTVNVFIAIFAFYLVATGWMTVRHNVVGFAEKFAMMVGIILCAPFVVLAFQLAVGFPPFFKSSVALKGPVLIAIYAFTSILVIAAVSDIKVVAMGGIDGAPRIARHLWRMCLGVTLAAGSAFTNGLPRLLPGPFAVQWYFFLPQFVPVVLLIFWMIRVRLLRKDMKKNGPNFNLELF